MVRTLLLALVVALSTAGSVMAGPFEDGEAAYNRQDYATALRLWKPLAEQGNADAAHSLGLMYEMGRGVPQDYAEAVRWYRKRAEQGEPIAQMHLGLMYEMGRVAPQDYAEAVRWYRKAAEQGDSGAQSLLGLMYEKGRGVPQSYVLAHVWLNLSASRETDSKMHAQIARARDRIAAKMTPAQIAEAQRRAREWKPKPER